MVSLRTAARSPLSSAKLAYTRERGYDSRPAHDLIATRSTELLRLPSSVVCNERDKEGPAVALAASLHPAGSAVP